MPEMPLVYDPTHFMMQERDIRMKPSGGPRDTRSLRDAALGKIQERFGQGRS